MKNKLIILLIVSMFLITSVNAQSASMGTFKMGSIAQLVQVCNNCTWINITVISYPNGSLAYSGERVMVNITRNNLYFMFNRTDEKGTYEVCGHGNVNGIDTPFCATFDVTPTGKGLTSALSITYILIFVLTLLVFGGLITLGLTIPSGNKRDEITGYVLYVSNLKYLKLILLALSYIVLVFLVYFSWMMCYAYLDMDFVTKILQFCFYFLATATLPLFILFVYITIANLVRDNQIGDFLQRGLRIK